MDTAAQWPQDIVVKPMEEMVATCPRPPSSSSSVERKVRPHKEQALNCPRCNSTNTKFCYYNNYSLSQPRYFCKTCRRYWTEGGSLRNIPVGGGSRKNKRSASSSSSYNSNSSPNSFLSSNNSSKKLPDLVPGPQQQQQQQQNPKMNFLEPRDLDLGFSIHNPHQHNDFKAITDMIQVPNFENIPSFNGGIRTSLELQNPSSFNYAFIPLPPVTSASGADQTAVFGSGFPNLPDHPFKSSPLDFSLDHGLGGSFGSFQGVQEANGNNNNSNNGNNKLLFPFENLKQDRPSNANGDDGEPENRDNQNGDSSAGYWNGVIGGGSW